MAPVYKACTFNMFKQMVFSLLYQHILFFSQLMYLFSPIFASNKDKTRLFVPHPSRGQAAVLTCACFLSPPQECHYRIFYILITKRF